MVVFGADEAQVDLIPTGWKGDLSSLFQKDHEFRVAAGSAQRRNM